MPSFEGNLFTQWHQITSLKTRDPRLPYHENPESLSHLGLIRYRCHGLSLPAGRVYQKALLRMRDLLTYHGGLSLPGLTGPALGVRKLPYRLELPTHKQHLETTVAK